MRFLRHEKPEAAYPLFPPYPQARAALLRKRPEARPAGAEADGPAAGGAADAPRVWAVVVDLGLEDYLVTIYAFADGTISIFGSSGIHSTGLRGADRVVTAAAVLREATEAALPEFSPIDDAGALPLPARGHVQILARTPDGDFAAAGRLAGRHGSLATLTAIALQLLQLARMAVIEGFDPVEAGEFVYRLAPEYRRMRSTLLDWIPRPDPSPEEPRVAGVAVEYGEGEAVTSLFAFDDGSTSMFSSDGRFAEGLSGLEPIDLAARGLRESVEAALDEFHPVALLPPPQPGSIQFVARTRARPDAESTRLRALATAAELADPSHPLAAVLARANELRTLADRIHQEREAASRESSLDAESASDVPPGA